MKTKTNISFTVSFIVFLISAALIGYAIYQIETKTNLIKTHYAEDSQNTNLSSSNKLKKEQEALLQQETVFKKGFLTQDEIILFISDIELKAAETGLKIEITKVERGTEETVGSAYKIQPISLSVSLEGDLNKTTSFIQKITNQEKILQLKEFKMYKINDTNNSHNTRIVLLGNILNI
jgi:Tfp pilus assembly protein PilO